MKMVKILGRRGFGDIGGVGSWVYIVLLEDGMKKILIEVLIWHGMSWISA